MDATIVFLFLSIILFYVVIYLVLGIWFRGKRNAYLKAFLAIGLIISFWALFNGIVALLPENTYREIYPHYLILGCITPQLLLYYILHFTGSRLARSRVLISILIATAVVDIVVLITNPLHHLFIAGFDGLYPIGGAWFPIHAVIGYGSIIIAVIMLIRYVAKNIKKNRALIFVVIAIILPILVNVLYTFAFLSFEFELTPFVFLIMIIIFSAYSASFRLFDNRNTAFMSLFNTFSEAFLIIDHEGFITDSNPSFKKAFPSLKLENDKSTIEDVTNFFEAIVVEQNPHNTINLFNSHNEEILNAEITLMIDDKPCHFVLSKTNVYERDQHAGFIITLIDVSNNQRTRLMIEEINENNKRLVELKDIAISASKAKSDFLANMSHEIRTPMNAIIGMTSIGIKTTDRDEKDIALHKISSASSHLLGVINDVLDMSKIEANKLELDPIEFNFERMCQKAMAVVNFRIDEKQQLLFACVDKDIPHFLIGDEQRLIQVITNLLSNAVKFTPNEGEISLKGSLIGLVDEICEIRIEVSDSGIGISPEQQRKLFDAFEQAERGTSREYGGTGLGLVISKSIVELMDGRIWVESELGEGATFIFTVKMQRGQKKPHSLLTTGVNWETVKILAVDDMAETRDQFVNLFRELKIDLDVAVDGLDACRMIEENGEYDIYFIDWKMPGMDGIELTRHIKSRQSGKQSVVIMITAMDWDSIKIKARDAGVDKHLLKPFFNSSIIDCVNECLGVAREHEKVVDNPDGEFEGKTLLVVEDIEINREILLALLENTGLTIECAENGQIALDMVEADPEKYDIIFMDMQMPRMDGLDATRCIRALRPEHCTKVPIIAMTANVFKDDIEACLVAGMNDHMGKPLDLSRVLEKLRTYLKV